ncbi:hypothetical protein ACIQPT_35510 [Streptomyces sp. NPDC091289]|uniref:hypothetical protein n=1 Tax=Streptomyces sp. NPDC091289 TaxID=3365989 RepID=UPI0038076BEB
MRKWNRAVPAALGALALTVTLVGCTDTDDAKGGKGGKNAGSSEEKKTFRLGERSPSQGSMRADEEGATYTVTPTRVETGTKADMDHSGLDLNQLPGPKVPVHVWSTLTHTEGRPMRIREMAGDLVIRTDQGERTEALLVWMGEATWKNCPEPDSEKKVGEGKSEKICTTFLITRGTEPEAVELTRGWYKEPLEWVLKG